jgi:membrane associated rhomboid family serine protease
MFRSRGENLRSTYILLFLNIAFFMLQYQDGQKFARLFHFDRQAVMAGEVWRLFTYQFMQADRIGSWTFPPVISLFVNLLLLTMMGMAVEEEWGTRHFIRLYLLSTLGTACVGAYTNTPLLGAFFVNFTLVFVYASLYSDQVLYFIVLPIRVTWLAAFSVATMVFRIFVGDRGSLAALIGAAAGYAYYLSQRVRVVPPIPSGFAAPVVNPDHLMRTTTRNLARVAAVKKALSTASDSDIDRLIDLSDREIVRGVNICAPADYKPEHSDRYCVRCEGFAECTARHLRLNRPKAAPPAESVTPAEQPT